MPFFAKRSQIVALLQLVYGIVEYIKDLITVLQVMKICHAAKTCHDIVLSVWITIQKRPYDFFLKPQSQCSVLVTG